MADREEILRRVREFMNIIQSGEGSFYSQNELSKFVEVTISDPNLELENIKKSIRERVSLIDKAREKEQKEWEELRDFLAMRLLENKRDE